MSEKQDRESELLGQIRQRLDAAESHLDAHTLRELRLARHKALDELRRPRRVWQPVGLAAAATVAALAIGLHTLQTTTITTAPGMEDMHLLSAGDDLELYENLEFYQWLEFEARNG